MKRLAPILALCLVAATLGGCLAQPPAGGTTDTTTAEPLETTNVTTEPGTVSADARAREVVADIRAKQRNISTYRATEIERRVYHLSNGSTLSRERRIEYARKYANGTMLQRRVYEGRPHVLIRNETHSVHYNRTANTYSVSPRRGSGVDSYFVSGIYEARDEFEAAFEDGSLSYKGRSTLLGHETHVIEFDNPRDPGNVSWYRSTFWIDADSGALVRSETTYPAHFRRTVEEFRSGERSRGTPDEDAVTIENVTATFTYEDLAVNGELPEDAFRPPANATREGTEEAA